MYGLVIEQLSQGIKIVVKKYEHEQGGKKHTNKQTNKQIPVRYRKDTGLQQCHQSEAPCLPRTLCSKGT